MKRKMKEVAAHTGNAAMEGIEKNLGRKIKGKCKQHTPATLTQTLTQTLTRKRKMERKWKEKRRNLEGKSKENVRSTPLQR